MDPLYLAADFPRLYHAAEPGSWPSIERQGLLSTSALLDLFEIDGDERERLESRHRPHSIPLRHPVHGAAVVRDQKPLDMKRLAACLTDMTTEEWLRTLNRRVFFWTSEERLTRLLGAAAYRHQEHDVLVVDTRGLVERYERQLTLSPINSGATRPTAVPRGSSTFRPLALYPYEEWRRKRGQRDAVVEVAVESAVPDVVDLVLRVERRRRGAVVGLVFSP